MVYSMTNAKTIFEREILKFGTGEGYYQQSVNSSIHCRIIYFLYVSSKSL